VEAQRERGKVKGGESVTKGLCPVEAQRERGKVKGGNQEMC